MAFLLGAYGPISTQIAQKIKKGACTNLLTPNSATTIEDQNFFCIAAYDKKNDDVIPVGDTGIIVGKLFRKKDHETVYSFPQNEQITAHAVADTYWGRYVSVLFNKNAQTLSLLRDPLGLSTAYYYQVDTSIIFSTEIAPLYDLLDQKPNLDWNYFVEFLLDQNHALPTTPFEGLKEILPGVNYTLDRSGIREELVWHLAPQREHFASTPAADIEEGLFHELTSCTRAWARSSKGITVELSGGVDSSSILVLLTSLVDKEIPITAAHYNDSLTPSSQEFKYAQQITRDCGISLNIIDLAQIPLIGELPENWRPAKPSNFLLSAGMSQRLFDYADQSACPDIMSGQGGDHVFLAPPQKESLADYWLDHGLRGISSPLNELSAQFRTSGWELAKHSIKALTHYYRGRITPQKEINNKNLFTPARLDRAPLTSFYLDSLLKRHYPAKALQIKVLSHAVAYADRDQRFSDKVVTHPLLSQPLVEYALKIPTYRTIKDNYNRYFLRKAISRLTQSPVIWRKNKGEVTASYVKAMMNEFDTVRTLLKEGSLVKSGILSHSWLDDNLQQIRHGKGTGIFPFLRTISCQLWLNLWNL